MSWSSHASVAVNGIDRRGYVVGAGLGAALALYVFGLPFILGTSAFWSYPVGDANMQLTGYRYFVTDAWHWPLLKTTLIGEPEGVNILQLDAIPLVAIAGKIWHGLSGRTVNLYGLWMLCCYALQGVLAVRLARAMGERGAIATLATSVVALSAPAFLLRFYHEGLCAHFVVLWALALHFELGREWEPRRATRSLASVSIIALLCHPYLAAMVLPIVVATLLRGSLRRTRSENVARAIVLLAIAGVLILCGIVTGHISGSVLATLSSDYGKASLNVLAPLVPLPGHSVLWKEIPPDLQEATGLQWDGAFFLGFGVLALLSIHVVTSARQLVAHVREHAVLVTCFAALTLYAFSNRIYFSTKLIATYPIPGPLQWVANQFRSTGRMFWPVGYFILIATVIFTLRRFRRAFAVGSACVIAAVHALEAGPSIAVVQRNTREPWATYLDWDEWRAAIHAHTRVRQIPSFACTGVFGLSRWGYEAREVQFIAAIEGRPINGVRMARGSPDAYCERELATYGEVRDEDDVLSLFPRAQAAKSSSSCIPIDSFYACSGRLLRDPSLLATTRLDPSPVYALGTQIDFLPDRPLAGTLYLDSDWGPYEGERIWTGTRDAKLRLRVSPEKSDDYEVVLNAEAALAPSHPSATVHVLSRDVELGTFVFTVEDNDTRTPRVVKLPRSLAPGGEVHLAFRVDAPILPTDHGVVGPRSRVGVALHRVWVR